MKTMLAHLFGIGRAMLVKDDGTVQQMQISQGHSGSDDAESVTDTIPVIGMFGLSSSAPEKTEVLLLRLGGDRSQSMAIGTNHRPSRPTGLKPGEVKLYDEHGAYIFLSLDGIVIDAAGKHVTIQNADTVTVKASTKVRLETATVETTGDFVSRCDGTAVSLNGLRDAYAEHKHTGITVGTALTGASDHPA